MTIMSNENREKSLNESLNEAAKRIIKYALLMAAVVITMTSCTAWEDSCTECIPLPEVETPVTPDPWEPGGEEHETGD